MTQKDILTLISNDPWMMDVLKTAQTLDLPDWWVGAGFVRNKVWDILHDYTIRTQLNDIDLIYFDPKNTTEESEKNYEKRLKKLFEGPWSVKNQARMHRVKNEAPYTSAVEGMSRWVETATCVGVTLDTKGKLKLAAPHGIEDLLTLTLRPVKGQEKGFYKRLKEKNWPTQWPRLTIAKLTSDS